MYEIYYNLFLRNWKSNAATEADIDKAVEKGFISEKQGNTIKTTERTNA